MTEGAQLFARSLKPLLKPGRHKLIGCMHRTQGLMTAPGNPLGLRLIQKAYWVTWWVGVALLWVAGALTLITGFDYFRKALPHLKDER